MRRTVGWVVVLALVAGTVAYAQNKTTPGRAQAPTLSPELKKLDRYVGEWTYTGQVKKNPIMPVEKFTGRVTARWVLGGAFLESRIVDDVPAGKAGVEVLEYDFFDEVAKKLVGQQYITGGIRRTFTIAPQADGFLLETDRTVSGKPYKVKITARFAKDGKSYTEAYQLSPDGKSWVPFCDVKYQKLSPKK